MYICNVCYKCYNLDYHYVNAYSKFNIHVIDTATKLSKCGWPWVLIVIFISLHNNTVEKIPLRTSYVGKVSWTIGNGRCKGVRVRVKGKSKVQLVVVKGNGKGIGKGKCISCTLKYSWWNGRENF